MHPVSTPLNIIMKTVFASTLSFVGYMLGICSYCNSEAGIGEVRTAGVNETFSIAIAFLECSLAGAIGLLDVSNFRTSLDLEQVKRISIRFVVFSRRVSHANTN